MECSHTLLKTLTKELKDVVNRLENGNSNLSEDELEVVIKTISNFSNREQRMSRAQAARYLHMNIKTFDNHVKSGELPKGTKELGLKEHTWVRSELDDHIQKLQNHPSLENYQKLLSRF